MQVRSDGARRFVFAFGTDNLQSGLERRSVDQNR